MKKKRCKIWILYSDTEMLHPFFSFKRSHLMISINSCVWCVSFKLFIIIIFKKTKKWAKFVVFLFFFPIFGFEPWSSLKKSVVDQSSWKHNWWNNDIWFYINKYCWNSEFEFQQYLFNMNFLISGCVYKTLIYVCMCVCIMLL